MEQGEPSYCSHAIYSSTEMWPLVDQRPFRLGRRSEGDAPDAQGMPGAVSAWPSVVALH